MPFYFVSASDGTNVVKAFRDSMKLAVGYKENATDVMDQILEELNVSLCHSVFHWVPIIYLVTFVFLIEWEKIIKSLHFSIIRF